MRDQLKDIEYFEKRYKNDSMHFEEICSECNDALAELAEKGDDYKGKIHLYFYEIALEFQMKFYSGYSLGLPMKELKKDFPKLVDAILNSWKGEVYDDIEFVLCLAIIFDIDRNKMKPILDLLIKYDYQDYILDNLAHYINSDFTIRTSKMKYKKKSSPIAKIIKLSETSKEDAVSSLVNYLHNKWFSLQTDSVIDNQSHLRKDQYRGYWSIESAALVKMLGLNDDILKDCKYYPYDLLH